MGVIHYWIEYINEHREYIKSDKFIVNLSTKNSADNSKFSKYFFFKNRVELIKFIKYVALPTFVYNKIDIKKKIDKIQVQDYKDILNYFMKNEVVNSREIIKRYSYFYNSLEELEYQRGYDNEKDLLELLKKIDNYFLKDEFIKSSLKVFFDVDDFLESILENENLDFNEKLIKGLSLENKEELKRFLSVNKDNEDMINFLIKETSHLEDKSNIMINI